MPQTYSQTGAVKNVASDVIVADTVALLRDVPRCVNRSVAILLGSTAAYDTTADGVFVFNSASTDADDGTSVIKPDDVSAAGRWVKIV